MASGDKFDTNSKNLLYMTYKPLLQPTFLIETESLHEMAEIFLLFWWSIRILSSPKKMLEKIFVPKGMF